MSEGINQNALDNICDKALLHMKFKSSKWEIFLNDPSKRQCFKYKKFEETSTSTSTGKLQQESRPNSPPSPPLSIPKSTKRLALRCRTHSKALLQPTRI